MKLGKREEDTVFDNVWLKGFKDGDTDVQFLEPVKRWVKYYEHFDKTAGERGKFFGCAARDLPVCEGCNSEDDKTAKASPKWAVNGLDSNGRHNLYKVGAKIKKQAQALEQRGRDITRKPYIVSRSGQGFDTEYVLLDDSSVAPVDPDGWQEKLYDATDSIGATYTEYLEMLSERDEWPEDGNTAGATSDVVAFHDEPQAEPTEQEQVIGLMRQTGMERDEWPEGGNTAEQAKTEMEAQGLGDPAKKAAPAAAGKTRRDVTDYTEDEIDKMDVATLRTVVDEGRVLRGLDTLPPRTPRSKLLAEAKRLNTEPPF